MDFSKLFEEAHWEPIKYKKKLIRISDTLPIHNYKNYEITFIDVKSEWEQGVFIHCKGCHFKINDDWERLNAFHLWHSESPKKNFFTILKPGRTELKMWNIWRIDKGPMIYGTNGGAMYYEEFSDGRKYYCNDGFPDDDFDDLVVEIKWS